MRKEITGLVHHLDACLGVRDADVDVQPKNEELADDVLQLVLEDLVALGLGHLLVLPVRKGMRAGRGDPKPRSLNQRRERAAEGRDLGARLADVRADLGPRLDDGLHHLGLDLLTESGRGGREERFAVAFQLAVAVDDLELLLDPDGQARNAGLSHRVAVPRRPTAPLSASIMPRCRESCRIAPRIQFATVPYSVGDVHGTVAGSNSASRARSSSRTCRTARSAAANASLAYATSLSLDGSASSADASSSIPIPVSAAPSRCAGKPHFAESASRNQISPDAPRRSRSPGVIVPTTDCMWSAHRAMCHRLKPMELPREGRQRIWSSLRSLTA